MIIKKRIPPDALLIAAIVLLPIGSSWVIDAKDVVSSNFKNFFASSSAATQAVPAARTPCPQGKMAGSEGSEVCAK